MLRLLFISLVFYFACSNQNRVQDRHYLSHLPLELNENIKNRGPSSIPLPSGLVVLVYHLLDAPGFSTNISPKLFREHLTYLKQKNFNVVSLKKALVQIKTWNLPKNSVAITFDDAYSSTLDAHEILREFHFPYTIFVSTEKIGHSPYLSWADLKKLKVHTLPFALKLEQPKNLIFSRGIVKTVLIDIPEEHWGQTNIQCFFNGTNVPVKIFPNTPHQARVKINQQLEQRRSKLTCTGIAVQSSSPGRLHRFYWNTFIFIENTIPEG